VDIQGAYCSRKSDRGNCIDEAQKNTANSDKIRKELSWQPRFEDLETILRTPWLWHQNDANHKKTYFEL